MYIKLSRLLYFGIVLFFVMMTAGISSAADVSIELVGSYDVFSPSYYLDSVAILDNNAYVIINAPDITHPVIYSDLERIDISDPVKPAFKDYMGGGFAANDVALSGTHAYLADIKSLQIVPLTPTDSSFDNEGAYYTDNSASVSGVAVSGNYAYLNVGGSSLIILDVTTPSSPKYMGRYDTGGYGSDDAANGIAVSSPYAYLATPGIGLVVVDVSSPSSPKLAGSYDLAGDARDVTVSGKYAYVISNRYASDDYVIDLDIIDITNPSSPKHVSTYFLSDIAGRYGYGYDIAVAGNYAYIADSYNGLVIVDISNPLAPTLAGSYDTASGAKDVAVSGNNVYLAAGNSGLLILKTEIQDQPLTEGSLVQVPGSPEVYLIENGLKRHFTSPEALEWNGYSFSDVIQVSSETLASIPNGADISITQAIIDKYHALGGSPIFGQPVGKGELDGESDSAGNYCSYVNFQNGAIDCFKNGPHAGEAYAIFNPLFTKWGQLGYGAGILGYPIEDMSKQLTSKHTIFRYQNFSNGDQRGALEYDINSGKVVEIHGAIFAKWAETGFASGVLGLVTEDENTAAESPFKTVGKYSKFENGTIHWISNKEGENLDNPHRGESFVTYGGLDKFYTEMKGTYSNLGFPIMDQKDNGYCSFEGGSIEWDESTGVYKMVSYASPLIVNTGFMPNPNGYQFENFESWPALSWKLFREIYGGNLVDNNDIATKFYNEYYFKKKANCFGISASSLVLYKNNCKSWDLAGKSSLPTFGRNRDLDSKDIFTDLKNIDYNDNGKWDPAPRTWGIFPSFISTPTEWVEYYQGRQFCPAVLNVANSDPEPNDVFYSIKSRMSSGNWINDPMVIGFSWWSEDYTDSNGNGFYDEGEPFIDEGWSFVDENGKIAIKKGNGKINDAGHAVVPYKIEEVQDHSSAKVFVYDSNMAGNSNIYFEFNLIKNEVSPLKDETTNEFIGGYHDNYLRINAYPIVALNLSTIEQTPERIPPLEDVSNSAQLLYTDAFGNNLGYLNGEFKSEISGAYRVGPNLGLNDFNDSSEIYFVPELDLKREICGLSDDITTVTLFKANTLVVAEVQVSSGSVDELYIPKDGSSTKFVSGKETSFLSLMLEKEKTGVAQIARANITQIEANGAVNLSNNDGTIIIQNRGLPRNCSLHLEQAVVNPNSGDSIKSIVIEEDSTIIIKSINWSNLSNLNITVEHDVGSDSTIEYAESVQMKDSTVSDSKSGGGGGGSSGGSSSSKSSGGGGGGAGSAEDYSNVAMKDVDTQYLRMNANVTYEFMREGNPVQSISFYSLKNSGQITSTIEVLNNRSKLVNSTPEGSIYKYVNIWVGKSGFATVANIKDSKVRFKVNSSWLEEMGVSPADVKLQRYNDTAWEVLPTTIESNTTGYVIFEAQTPGFSPFAITAEKVLASSTSDNMDTISTQTEKSGMNGTQPEKTPGFGFSMTIFIVGVFAGGHVYLKRRQN